MLALKNSSSRGNSRDKRTNTRLVPQNASRARSEFTQQVRPVVQQVVSCPGDGRRCPWCRGHRTTRASFCLCRWLTLTFLTLVRCLVLQCGQTVNCGRQPRQSVWMKEKNSAARRRGARHHTCEGGLSEPLELPNIFCTRWGVKALLWLNGVKKSHFLKNVWVCVCAVG